MAQGYLQEQRKKFYTARILNLTYGSQSIREIRKRQVNAIFSQAESEVTVPLSPESYRFLGAALYWAEGTKKYGLEITNSDPLLIVFMVEWFSKMFGVPPQDMRAWLNIYPQQDDNDLKRFWSEVTGIPYSRFGKSFVKPISKGYKKNNLYYGTIKVRVPKSTDYKIKLLGWLRAALKGDQKQVKQLEERWKRLRDVEKPINLQ